MMFKRAFAIMLAMFMVLGAFIMLPGETEAAETGNVEITTWCIGGYDGNAAYLTANPVSYKRIMVMGFDLSGDVPAGSTLSSVEFHFNVKALSSVGNLYIYDSAAHPNPTNTTVQYAWTEGQVNSYCPSTGQLEKFRPSSTGWQSKELWDSSWQTQFDSDGKIYISMATWDATDTTYYIYYASMYVVVTYTAPSVPWAPTITSSSSGNDTVCFMDPYVYEFSANETVTWELVSVTPPAGGNATWLDMEDEFLAGVPFPICGPDGIGEYEVSVKATSTEGTLSSYQNFTLTVTADRSGFDLYETFGDLVIETQQPGLYGWGTAVQNSTLTWDVNDTELYYGGFDADELTGYGWELHTVAMTDPELVFVLTHNDTERTYGIYGKDDLEALNGTAAIQYLDARIEVEDSVIYARLLDINISAYYFGITGITVNGRSVTLPEFSLPEDVNATFIVSTTLDWLEEEYGYDVQTVSIGLSSTDFQSWIGGDAANSTTIFQLTDAYGDYWLNWTMRILDGETVLARAHLATLLTIREPYAPEITSTAMAKAYVGEEYSFTFAAVETDLFILQYPVPSWATWDNATGTFTGTPEVGDLGVYMIVVYPYNTTDGITGDPFYAQFIVRPAAEAGDGIGFFGYVFSSIIALLFCIFLSISKDGFNATVFMALVPMAIAVLISVGAMPLWTIIVGILFYGILIFRNVGPGDSL
jgi:hypothetical protein